MWGEFSSYNFSWGLKERGVGGGGGEERGERVTIFNIERQTPESLPPSFLSKCLFLILDKGRPAALTHSPTR